MLSFNIPELLWAFFQATWIHLKQIAANLAFAFISGFRHCLFEFLLTQLDIRVSQVRKVLDFQIELLLYFRVKICFKTQISGVDELLQFLVDFAELLLYFIGCVNPYRRETCLQVGVLVRGWEVMVVTLAITNCGLRREVSDGRWVVEGFNFTG